MDINTDIFKIETNHVLPSRGKVLISEPFLYDEMFGRSIILLVDHTLDGTMGLVLNKSLPLYLNDVLKDFKDVENIPIYKGGPLCTDTLFYLHTLKGVKDSLEIEENTWLIGSTNIASLMDEKGSAELWKNVLGELGGKYQTWSRFPQIPTLN